MLTSAIDDESEENVASNSASKQFLPHEVDALPKAAQDLLSRLLEINPRVRLKSILAMQKIAMFKDFAIRVETLKKISPKELIQTTDIPSTSADCAEKNNSAIATSAFKDF